MFNKIQWFLWKSVNKIKEGITSTYSNLSEKVSNNVSSYKKLAMWVLLAGSLWANVSANDQVQKNNFSDDTSGLNPKKETKTQLSKINYSELNFESITNKSIVDLLNVNKIDSSFKNRSAIFNEILNWEIYKGSSEQNIKMFDKLEELSKKSIEEITEIEKVVDKWEIKLWNDVVSVDNFDLSKKYISISNLLSDLNVDNKFPNRKIIFEKLFLWETYKRTHNSSQNLDMIQKIISLIILEKENKANKNNSKISEESIKAEKVKVDIEDILWNKEKDLIELKWENSEAYKKYIRLKEEWKDEFAERLKSETLLKLSKKHKKEKEQITDEVIVNREEKTEKKELTSLEKMLVSWNSDIVLSNWNEFYSSDVWVWVNTWNDSVLNLSWNYSQLLDKTTWVKLSADLSWDHTKLTWTLVKWVDSWKISLTANRIEKEYDFDIYWYNKTAKIDTLSIWLEYAQNISDLINDIKFYAAYHSTSSKDFWLLWVKDTGTYTYKYFWWVKWSKTQEFWVDLNLKLSDNISLRPWLSLENVKYDDLYTKWESETNLLTSLWLYSNIDQNNLLDIYAENTKDYSSLKVDYTHYFWKDLKLILWWSTTSFWDWVESRNNIFWKLVYSFWAKVKRTLFNKYDKNWNLALNNIDHITKVALNDAKNFKIDSKVESSLNALPLLSVSWFTTTNNDIDYDNTVTLNWNDAWASSYKISYDGWITWPVTIAWWTTTHTTAALADWNYNFQIKAVNADWFEWAVSSISTKEIYTLNPTSVTFSWVTPNTKDFDYWIINLTLDESLSWGSISSITTTNWSTIWSYSIDWSWNIIINNLHTHNNIPNTETLTISGTTKAWKVFTFSKSFSVF